MPKLLARAEYVTKLQAICQVCGEPTRTQRIINGEPAHYNDEIILLALKKNMNRVVAIAIKCQEHQMKNRDEHFMQIFKEAKGLWSRRGSSRMYNRRRWWIIAKRITPPE